MIFLLSTCVLFAQDAADVQFIYVENGKVEKQFTSFDELEFFVKELNEKQLKGNLFAASLMSLEALIVPEIPDDEGANEPPEPNPDAFISPIEGVHECYFTRDVEGIVSDKTIGSDHNPVLEILGLSKSGNERTKVERIINHLTELKLR